MPGTTGRGMSVMSIFTGTRCVILVKLPDGLGVGSSANRAVVALPMRATRPLKRSTGKASTAISTDWPSLKAQVQRWQTRASLDWSDADVTEVARFLNDTIYRHPQTSGQVGWAAPR